MAVEEINLQISKTQEYKSWRKDPHNETPKNIERYLDVLKQKGDQKPWKWLNLHVLVSCFCAEKYDIRNDPDPYEDKDRLDNLNAQLKTVSKFNRLIKKDPNFGIRFFLHACLHINSPGKVLFNIPKGQHDLLLKSIFEKYENALKRVIPADQQSQKRMLIARGGLLYCQFNPDGSKAVIQDIQIDSLRFHMTYIFRHFTDGKLDLGTEFKKMPKNLGQPRYDLTAKILNESSDKVRKHINCLVAKDVYIHPWSISL